MSGKYLAMEKRVEELESLFDSELSKAVSSDLLSEYNVLSEILYKRDNRNRIISNVIDYCVFLIIGFIGGIIFMVVKF